MTAQQREHEAVTELRAWARSRIDECRRQEQKFCEITPGTRHRGHPAQAAIEAWTERRCLQAVLRILDGEEGE